MKSRFLIAAGLLLALAQAVQAADLRAVWSDPSGDSRDIFYAEIVDGRPQNVTRVTSGRADDLTPALAVDGSGRLWLAWVRQDERDSSLYYSTMADGRWSGPLPIPTGFTHNSGVSLLIDGSDTPWAAWAGFDGRDDDIFVSRHVSGTWSPPVRVGIDDLSPDLYPVLGLGADGLPWVTWQGYDGQAYSSYFSRWDGTSWDVEALLEEDHPYRSQIEPPPGAAAGLGPAGVDAASASFYRKGAPVQSLPLRMERILR
jgi:hypothetical protein